MPLTFAAFSISVSQRRATVPKSRVKLYAIRQCNAN
jgi:hypothetical protein